MPSPSQIRDLRVRRLVAVAMALLEASVSFRLWLWLRERTQRSYTVFALRVTLSQPPVEFDLLAEAASPQEGK